MLTLIQGTDTMIHSNMKKSVDMLKEHYKLLEEEIRSKQRLAETIKEKIDFVDKVIDNNIELEKFSFEDFPERFSNRVLWMC